MTSRFRCPECKQALGNPNADDPTKGCVLECPQCGARLVVPPVLASLPGPQIEAPGSAVADDGPHDLSRHAVMLPTMARCMPWMVSMFLHLGLALIFMFVAMIVMPAARDIVGNGSHSVGIIDKNPPIYDDDGPLDDIKLDAPKGPPKPDDSGGQDSSRLKLDDPTEDNTIGAGSFVTGIRSNLDPANLSDSDADTRMFGIGDGDGDGEGDGTGGGDGNPPSGGRGPDVVYLIDRSGSMIDTFDRVRAEMLNSIRHLKPNRKFHVVMFSDGKPLEKLPRRMTPAGDRAKADLVEFLKPVRAYGQTDPIPAINRAFDALDAGSAGKPALIYLLTDGVFPDNEAVMKTIRRRSMGRRIRICTILYGNRPLLAEKVLRLIAAETKGEYQFVSHDE